MRPRSLLLTILVGTLARAEAPVEQRFLLYKFQQHIGTERSVTSGGETRTVFSFTDRATPVPLASLLRLGKDGAPLRFQIWGQTSRQSTIWSSSTASGSPSPSAASAERFPPRPASSSARPMRR